MFRVLAKTARRQPQTLPQVRQGHPLALGLIGAYLPASPSAKRIGAPVHRDGTDGVGFTVPSGSHYWQSAVAGTPSCVSVNPTWTILAVINDPVSNNKGRAVYCERPTDTQILKLEVNGSQSSSDFGFLVVRDAAGAGLVYMGKGGSFDSMVNGRSVITAVRRATNNHRIFINGVQTNADTSTTVPNNFATCDGLIGADPFDSSVWMEGISVPLILTWNRALTDGEIAQITANPWQIFRAPTRRLYVGAPPSSGTTVALTGVTGTGAVGTVVPGTTKALTGNAGTGAAGTGTPSTSKALTGNAGTGAVGSVTPVRAGAITGNTGTGAVGTVAPASSKALTGNAATGSVGSVAPARSAGITGNAAVGAAGVVTPNVTIPITGVSATGAVGTVTAETGGSAVSAALTGVIGTGSAGTVSPTLDKGITGNAATGALGSIAPATAKTLSGNASAGAVGAVNAASSKTLTGNAATGTAGAVSPGVTVALTGVSATGTAGSVTAGADATQSLTGVSGTGAAGVVGPSITIALAGVSGTGAVGSVTAGQPLTGVAGTGQVGTVAPSTSGALTGTSATGALGSVGPDITIALTGVESAGQVGTVSFVSGDITIALTGVEATGAVGVLAVAGEFSAIAAAVWSYVLSNGKTAGQNVVEIRSMLDLLAPGFWNLAIEGTYTAADLLRVIAAVQAGKSTITALGGGAATVEFRAVDDSETRVTATMAGSERTEVTLNVD